MQVLQFDYFRGMEAEQYSFYRVPKVLFTAECFKVLSCEAKVLYGLMLDRMGLSIKNRWFDEKDRVYIIFTVEEIADLMNCGTQKAVKLMKELDTDNGIGLIEKKRLGLGRPNVIYVKNFMIRQTVEDNEGSRGECADSQNGENHDSGIMGTTIQEYPESQFKNSENHNSRIVKTTIQEIPESQFKSSENHNSGIVKSEGQEFPKSQSIKTDIIKTDSSETDFNETDRNNGRVIPSNPILSKPSVWDGQDAIAQRKAYRQIIRRNIDYEYHAGEEVDELVELMVEVMSMPKGSMVRIAGVDRPVEVVKSQFMKLDYSHIEYVLFALHKNTTKVGNIKAYLLTTLYNAPMTISNYYSAEVNHDMYGGG